MEVGGNVVAIEQSGGAEFHQCAGFVVHFVAFCGEHCQGIDVVATVGHELKHEIVVHTHAATVHGALFERYGVFGVHIVGIGGGEHHAIVGVFPGDFAFHIGGDGECGCGGVDVHVPIKLEHNGLIASHRCLAIVPHGCIRYHCRRGVAHALQVDVHIGYIVGIHLQFGSFFFKFGMGNFHGVGAGIHIFEYENAVEIVVGGVGLDGFAGGVHQSHGGAVHGLEFVGAIHHEDAFARTAVVAQIAHHHAGGEVAATAEETVGTAREIEAFHPAIFFVEQAVGFGVIVVEGAFVEHGVGVVAA